MYCQCDKSKGCSASESLLKALVLDLPLSLLVRDAGDLQLQCRASQWIPEPGSAFKLPSRAAIHHDNDLTLLCASGFSDQSLAVSSLPELEAASRA